MKKPHKIGTSIIKKVDYSELLGKLVVLSAVFGVLYFITIFVLNEVNPNYKSDISKWINKKFSKYELVVVERAKIVCDITPFDKYLVSKAKDKCKGTEYAIEGCPYLYDAYGTTSEIEFNGLNVSIKRYLLNKKVDEIMAKYILFSGDYYNLDYGSSVFHLRAQDLYTRNISKDVMIRDCRIVNTIIQPSKIKFEPDNKEIDRIKEWSMRRAHIIE